MPSRTTKQAARAYQKAHGVPYAEALSRVLTEERDATNETQDSDGAIQLPAMKGNSLTATFAGLTTGQNRPVNLSDLHTPLGSLDPLAALFGEDEPHEAITGAAGFSKTLETGAAASLADDFYSSDPNAESPDLSIHLGLTAHMTGFDNIDLKPLTWNPHEEVAVGRPPVLGVFGPDSARNTGFLAALAADLPASTAYVLTSAERGHLFAGQEVHDVAGLASAAVGSEPSAGALGALAETTRTARTVILDAPTWDFTHVPMLRFMLRHARSAGKLVLFSSQHLDTYGEPDAALENACGVTARLVDRLTGEESTVRRHPYASVDFIPRGERR